MSAFDDPSHGADVPRWFSAIAPFVFVILLFSLSLLIVGLKGNFPLNDDWSYAEPVRKLVYDGDWRPTNWSAPNLLSQSLWVAPFCALTDCSFESLRLSSLVATVILTLFSYLLFERVTNSTLLLLASLLLVVFNPIEYLLSYTIMTDVFYAMAMTASAYFLIRSLENDSLNFLVLGTLVAIVAILCRQIGVCLPIGYAVVRLVQRGALTRRLRLALAPLAVCIVIMLGFPEWLRHTGRLPINYNFQLAGIADSAAAPALFLVHIFGHLTVILTYTGLFSAPLLLLTKQNSCAPSGWRRWLPTLFSFLLVIVSISRMIHLRKSCQ